ncbi:MAG: alpha/beta hydrolase [Verrucomicrobiota bacterium]
MRARYFGLCLATTAATAQPPDSAADVRALLQDPNGDLSRLAQGMIGKKGGNQLFYFPTRDEPSTPTAWGLKFETINFKSADGTPLHGWFIPAKDKAAKSAKGTVVFSHGNAGSISYHLGFCAWLAEASYNVIIYDYRGFGKSGGTVDRRGMIDDVKAAFAYALKRPDIDTNRLISFGHSLGGAQSVTALGESPVKGLRAIVVDGAFASYRAMARIIGGQFGANLVTDELSPKDFVSKLAPVPLLVVHGAADEIVPVSQGLQLYEAAAQPKTLFEVKAGHHGTALSKDNGAYRKKMIAWLDGVMKG